MTQGPAVPRRSTEAHGSTVGLARPPTFAEEFEQGPPARSREHIGRQVSALEFGYILHRFLEGDVASRIALALRIHRSTVYRAIRRMGDLPWPIFHVLFTRVPIQRPFGDPDRRKRSPRFWAYFCRQCGVYLWEWDEAMIHIDLEWYRADTTS